MIGYNYTGQVLGVVAIPFETDLGVTVYRSTAGYYTNFIPQSKAITDSDGVVVYMSPTGSDTADGLTVYTPKLTLSSALAVTNVTTIVLLPGTYTVGTHFAAGQEVTSAINLISACNPTIETGQHNLTGVGGVIIDSGEGAPIIFKDNLYCEGVMFRGGNNTVIVRLADTTKHAVFYRCMFCNSYTLNGLAMEGGLAYVVDCEAYGNAYDGFNYHEDSVGGETGEAIEIKCRAYNNGQKDLSASAGQSSNGTTAHDDYKIIRVSGEYYACHGGIVADKDCTSANYGCKAGISTITNASYPDRMSNYWSSGATMYLYGCVSFGSKYDTAVIRSGEIISDVTYPSNYEG